MSARWGLANALTASRLLLAAPIAALILANQPNLSAWALALFALAGVTDFFDGRVARARGEVSAFGAWLDPMADKALTLGALGALALSGAIPAPHGVAVAVIFVREILVALARRNFAAPAAEATAPLSEALKVSDLGKWKTAAQFAAIAALIAAESGLPMRGVGLAALWIAAGLTVASGAGYAAAALNAGRRRGED